MQVFLQIVAFSLQTDWSGRSVLAKGKRPKNAMRGRFPFVLKIRLIRWLMGQTFPPKMFREKRNTLRGIPLFSVFPECSENPVPFSLSHW